LRRSLEIVAEQDAFEEIEYAIEGITAARLGASILESEYLNSVADASALRAMLEGFLTCSTWKQSPMATRERTLPSECASGCSLCYGSQERTKWEGVTWETTERTKWELV
jgi:hypothetical protein